MTSSSRTRGLLARPGIRQLVKFCIVGFSSTVLDKGTLFALLTAAEKWAPQFPWWGSQSISFCVGVTNGYIWNRLWTFQARGEGHASAREQYVKFVVSNIIGYLLNLFFTKLFLIAFTGQVVHEANPGKWAVMLASICAIPIVVIWNFSVAKFWTFRAPKPRSDTASPVDTALQVDTARQVDTAAQIEI